MGRCIFLYGISAFCLSSHLDVNFSFTLLSERWSVFVRVISHFEFAVSL